MKKLNIYSPVNALGFGVHGQNMLKALVDNDVDVNLTIIGQSQPNEYYSKYVKETYDNYESFSKSNPSLFIFHDEYLNQCMGNPVVAFSVFETTKLSQRALFNLKHVADRVFTTTSRHKKLLEAQGVVVPIDVVHEGVDPVLYNTEKGVPFIDTGKFTYITVGKHEERKNTDLIITAFIQTMQYKECALLCHTYNPFTKKHTDVEFEKYGFKQLIQKPSYMMYSNGICDIYLTYPINDQKSMKSLYHSANIGIQCSKAEGFDLPIHELMACGVLCIASNVIGHSEGLNGAPVAQQSLIIEPSGMEVANDGVWFHGDRGDWAVIKKEDLCDLLEDTYDDQGDYLTLNQDLSKYYHDNYNWNLPAIKVKKLFT